MILAMIISSGAMIGVRLNPSFASGSVGDSEPLSNSTKTVTRSFSFHTTEFQGNPAGNLTIFGTWYPNGTVAFSDVRGHEYVLQAPSSKGSFSIYQNSTVIDQRFRSESLNYDIYWKAKRDLDGFTDTLKFDIVGNSDKVTTLSFKVNSSSNEALLVQQNGLLISNSYNDLGNPKDAEACLSIAEGEDAYWA